MNDQRLNSCMFLQWLTVEISFVYSMCFTSNNCSDKFGQVASDQGFFNPQSLGGHIGYTGMYFNTGNKSTSKYVCFWADLS